MATNTGASTVPSPSSAFRLNTARSTAVWKESRDEGVERRHGQAKADAQAGGRQQQDDVGERLIGSSRPD